MDTSVTYTGDSWGDSIIIFITMSSLAFPAVEADLLEPHLPPLTGSLPSSPSARPFVTLTFATSLDSALSLGPGIRTTLSGPQSKAMTHYLRSRHDAILVGVGTAVADDPGLNCRIDTASRRGNIGQDASSHPRPVIIDPKLRWNFTRDSKVFQLVQDSNGLAPYVVTTVPRPPEEKRRILEEHGGKLIVLGSDNSGTSSDNSLPWTDILAAIEQEDLHSVMIEGGGSVINSLLASRNRGLVDSVIITIAPTWLGQGSVVVSPEQEIDVESGDRIPGPRLEGVKWIPLGEDVVVCGRLR